MWVTAQSFKKACNAAGEVKRPRQTVPFALLIAPLFCTAPYTLVQSRRDHHRSTTLAGSIHANERGSVILTIAAMTIDRH
jgi:hypothetical protein